MARERKNEDEWPAEEPESRRVPLGVRTTPILRAKLDLLARKSGRSLAQEVEFQLETCIADKEEKERRQSIEKFADEVFGILGTGDTGRLLITIARAIKEVETAQGTPWCSDKANLDAYDMNLKDVMAGIRRVWLHRSEATIADYMALEHPFLVKDPPKMQSD